MNYIIFRLLLILGMFLSIGCSSSEPSGENLIQGELIKSFSVTVEGGVTNGIIDNTGKTITLNGISNGNQITDVDVVLSDGVSIFPDPVSFIGNWDAEEKIQIKYGDISLTYTIILADYNKKSNIIYVNPMSKRQKIEFVGGDMERSQSFMQKASDPQAVANWCFKDIPFDICRVSYDKKQEETEGQKNMSFYDDAIRSMKNLKIANPDIKFWATMKSDYNGYNDQNNLPDWICDYSPTTRFDCDKYAVFLADYLEHMEDNGVRISYLATSKEWVGVITAERAKKIIEKLNSECENRNIKKPLYVDPASWGISQGVEFIKSASSIGSLELYYGFSTHNLNGNESEKLIYEKFVTEANKYGKFAFADETSTGAGGRTNGEEPTDLTGLIEAYMEKAEFYKDGIQGELFFEIFSRGVNAETRSVYFTNGGTPKRMRSYYVMKSFVEGICGGTHYVEPTHTSVDSCIKSMAFVDEEKAFLVVLNNGEDIVKNLGVSLVGEYPKANVEKMVCYDINEPIEGSEINNVEFFNNTLMTDVPAKSLTFITINYK